MQQLIKGEFLIDSIDLYLGKLNNMWIAINVEPETQMTGLVNLFQERAMIISDLYNKLLSENKLEFKGVKKVSISVTSVPDIDFVVGPIKGISPVASVRKTFDFDKLSSLDDKFFKIEILKLIHDSILKLGEKFGWETKGFNKIYNVIFQSNLDHVYYELPMKASPDKSWNAGVKVEMLEEGAQISMEFLDSINSDRVINLPMIMTHPNRMFITPIINNGKWISNDEFEVTNNSGEIHFIGSFVKKKMKLVFTPKEKSEKGLIDDLLLASTATKKDLVIDMLKENLRRNY